MPGILQHRESIHKMTINQIRSNEIHGISGLTELTVIILTVGHVKIITSSF